MEGLKVRYAGWVSDGREAVVVILTISRKRGVIRVDDMKSSLFAASCMVLLDAVGFHCAGRAGLNDAREQ